MQRIQNLHVREAVEKNDSFDDLVGVLHFLDGFLAPIFAERLVAPVLEQPIMQPILVDRGHLMPQAAVEIIDDFGVALHGQVLSKRTFSWTADHPQGRPAALIDYNVCANARYSKGEKPHLPASCPDCEKKSVQVV